jgi:hypothetical protein
LIPNSEFFTGFEAIEIANPKINPSAVMYNNFTGYVYNKLDIQIRNVLMENNGLFADVIKRLEAQGDFQPLHSQNYYDWYVEHYNSDALVFFVRDEYGSMFTDIASPTFQGGRGVTLPHTPRKFSPQLNGAKTHSSS